MFIQKHPQQNSSKELFLTTSKDFDFIIHSKSKQKIIGIIQFQYLQNLFTANIIITPSTIQIKGQQAFEGIQLNAPLLSTAQLNEIFYLQNGTLTKVGHQNIIWLIFDFIHLYNLLRLKPGKVLALYREVFSLAKQEAPNSVFGKLDLSTPLANRLSHILGQEWKIRFKYEFANKWDLLNCIQTLLTSYPLQFNQALGVQMLQKAIL